LFVQLYRCLHDKTILYKIGEYLVINLPNR